MPLADLIITVFCWVDEHLKVLLGEHRLRRRGFAPKLTDSDVITMEGVGAFLGLNTDVGLWQYFRRHGPSWFPHLGSRTPVTQPAAHLWVIKQRLHQQLRIELGAAKVEHRILMNRIYIYVCNARKNHSCPASCRL